MGSAGEAKVRPSRWWYGLSATLVAVAAGWFVVAATSVASGMARYDDQVQAMQEVFVPSEGPITFDEPGDYFAYYSGSAIDGEVAPSVTISLYGKGKTIDITENPDVSAISLAGEKSAAVGSFTLDSPGTFTLSIDGGDGSDATILVGKRPIGFGAGTVAHVIGSVALFLAAIAVAVVTGVRRHRAQTGKQPFAVSPTWVPAGWFADPVGSHQLRYWDGQQWTEYVHNDAVTTQDPLPDPQHRSLSQ